MLRRKIRNGVTNEEIIVHLGTRNLNFDLLSVQKEKKKGKKWRK